MGGNRRQLVAAAAAVAVLGTALLASASGGATSATPGRFDSRDFGRSGTNRWFPLEPGLQSVKQGFVSVGHRRLPARRVITITDVTRVIAGVRAVAVLDQDINGGEIAEQALDYVAADKHGNMWYFGSYTESYEGGQFVNASDAWLAGVRGAAPGILLPGDPRTGTAPYTQATVPGEDPTTGQIVKTGLRHCVPFKCYRNVVVVQEGSPSEPGVVEWKYYAPGVGGIRTEPRTGGEQETEALLNLRQLSARGLAELRAEALKLDKHARVTVPDVFGQGPAAKRTS